MCVGVVSVRKDKGKGKLTKGVVLTLHQRRNVEGGDPRVAEPKHVSQVLPMSYLISKILHAILAYKKKWKTKLIALRIC